MKDFDTLLKNVQTLIRESATEDKHLQAYLRGFEDALLLIAEAKQKGEMLNAAAAGGYAS